MRRFRLLLAATACVGLALALRSGNFQADAPALLARLESLRASGWLLPAYVVSVGLTTALVPALVFFVVAGALFGFGPGLFYGYAAVMLWSQLHFAVGRSLGGDRLHAWLTRRNMTQALDELEHGGIVATLILRQLPLPFVAVNAGSGASPVNWLRWSVGNALGLLPATLVYTYSADALIHGAAGARDEALVRTLTAAVCIIALGVGSRMVRRAVVSRPQKT